RTCSLDTTPLPVRLALDDEAGGFALVSDHAAVSPRAARRLGERHSAIGARDAHTGQPVGVRRTSFASLAGVASDCSAGGPGSVKKKVEPQPIRDSTQIFPPARVTIFLQVAKPIPLPAISGPC